MIDCLAASYRLDLVGAAYIGNLVREAAPLLDRRLGIIAYTYDASDPAQPRIDHFRVSDEFDRGWLPAYYAALETQGCDPRRPTGYEAWAT
jgi:hypothetical protein